jgi:intracellular multiplication protein IcmT
MTYWRDASRKASIFGIDARAYFPVFIWIVSPSWKTFYLSLASIVVFAALGKFGYTVPVAIRLIQQRARGRWCHARPWWVRRRFFKGSI